MRARARRTSVRSRPAHHAVAWPNLLTRCAIGVAISFLGFWSRSLVSATCYTVLGVANKMLTVLANAFVADDRASAVGVGCLVACLLCAAAYSLEPPRRTEEKRT